MTDDQNQPFSDPRLKPMTFALAVVAVFLAGALPPLFAQLPRYAQPWNVSIIGAIGLFAASRLGFWWAVGFTGLAIGCKDLSMYMIHHFRPEPLSWPFFIGYAVIGWAMVRHTRSPLRIGGAALTASLYFFLISNFACWLQPALGYERSFAGLMECYVKAVPFFRGTIVGDIVYSGVLFGAHAALCRVYLPENRAIRIEAKKEF